MTEENRNGGGRALSKTRVSDERHHSQIQRHSHREIRPYTAVALVLQDNPLIPPTDRDFRVNGKKVRAACLHAIL